MSKTIGTSSLLGGHPSQEAYVHEDLTRGINAAAFEVHNHLGRGFLEKVYALAVELKARGLSVRTQADLTVTYKGITVGSYLADVVVNETVACENQGGSSSGRGPRGPVLNYLKATEMKLGLLLNFGTARVQVKRLVF